MFGRHRKARRELQWAEESLQWARLSAVDQAIVGVVLTRGEIAYAVAKDVQLIEPRRAPGTRTGRYSGSSYRGLGRSRHSTGSSRSIYTPGEEHHRVTDEGTFVVTNQRCLFIGVKRTIEWAYKKLVGYTIARNYVALFNVSNRQKATGVQYSREQETMVASTIVASIAAFNSAQAHESLIAALTSDVLEARNALAARDASVLPPYTQP